MSDLDNTVNLTKRIVETLLLLQTGEKFYKLSLAKHFDCDHKTIKRMMNVLCEYYPIRPVYFGRELYYVWETSIEFEPLKKYNLEPLKIRKKKPYVKKKLKAD